MKAMVMLRIGALALLAMLAVIGAAQARDPEPAPQVFAFYAEWVRDGQSSLQHSLGRIDVLMPEWLTLGAEGAAFSQLPAEQTGTTLELVGQVDDQPLIAPVISNVKDGVVSPQMVVDALGSPNSRTRLVRELTAYVTQNGLSGITVAFHGWPPSLAAAYEAFAAELYDAFNPLGLQVYHALPMGGTPASPELLSRLADALIILGEAEAQGEPGPMASQSWYEGHLRRWTGAVAPHKLVFGVFNQARLWSPQDGGARSMSVMEALRLAQAGGCSRSTIRWR